MRVSLFLVMVLGIGAGRLTAGEPCATLNGDSNGDGGRDLSDAVYSLAFSFQGGPDPVGFCFQVGPKLPDCATLNGDVNGDAGIDLSDAVYSLVFSFQGGEGPVPPCPDAGGPEVCNDVFDNDGDGDTDCADTDCVADPSCIESVCDDFVDNDEDGLTDCVDPDCVVAEPILCTESICDNLEDDDGDGRADCADPDCFTEALCLEECFEDFDDGVLDVCWLENDDFVQGGAPGSLVLSGGVAQFVKTGTDPASTRGIGMSDFGGGDNRKHAPWSVEVTFPDVSQFPDGGGSVAFRFFAKVNLDGVVLHDWINLGHCCGGSLLVNSAPLAQIDPPNSQLFAFDITTTTSLTLKFDAEVSGLTVYAATDGGAFGAGVPVPWVNRDREIMTLDEFPPPGELTPLSLTIDSRDLFTPSPGPYTIWIDDLKLTSVAQ